MNKAGDQFTEFDKANYEERLELSADILINNPALKSLVLRASRIETLILEEGDYTDDEKLVYQTLVGRKVTAFLHDYTDRALELRRSQLPPLACPNCADDIPHGDKHHVDCPKYIPF